MQIPKLVLLRAFEDASMDAIHTKIPLRYLFNVKLRVAALNKKLAKRGVPEFVLTEGAHSVSRLTGDDFGGSIDVPTVAISITGEPFKLAGHALRGVFHRGQDDEPNAFKAFGDFKFSADDQKCGDRCDCCNKKRTRNAIFFIEKTEGDEAGRILQIGGDCAEIYLGVSPAAAINTIGLYEEALNILAAEESAGWDEEKCSVGGGRSYPLHDYLSAVAYCVRHEGWVSSAKAEERCIGRTADEASYLLGKKPHLIEECDGITASKAIGHYQDLYPIDDRADLEAFDLNLKQIAHATYVPVKSLGFAAWMVQGYLNSLEVERRMARASVSTYQGSVGDTVHVPVVIDRLNSYESQYGTVRVVSMSDRSGNAYVWKASSLPNEFHDVGAVMTISAKIKEHSEFRQMQQTRVTHVKMLSKHEFMPLAETVFNPVIEKKKKAKKVSECAM